MTAQLLWYVQKFDIITALKFLFEQDKFLHLFELQIN